MEKGEKTVGNRRNKILVAMMVVFISSGCAATLSEIRTKEPSYIISSTKTPQELSKCIEFKMRAELGSAFVVALEEYPINTYRIPLTYPGVSAIADILVKPMDSGSVVEFRLKDWYLKGTIVPQMEEIIERCAK